MACGATRDFEYSAPNQRACYCGVGPASFAAQLTLDMPFSMLIRLAICSSLAWSFG